MCGIAAIVRLDQAPADLADLRRICSAVAHRGPDGAGFALLGDGAVALGHVRLSIVDLAGGAQPLYNEDATVAAVCNGEIYDYPRLRRELTRRGHRFRTTSDSELLVHLYEEHGTDLFGHLNGEYAFLLWDGRRRRLLAGRDPCGIKPLYYHHSPREVMFCSEGKGLLALDRVGRRLSTRYLAGPALGVHLEDASAFEQVRSLRPGHFLTVEADGQWREQAHYRQQFRVEESMSFAEAAGEVHRRLEEAVRLRLAADVPVHAYLSGGLDSAIVCGLMARCGARFTCFNVGFPGTPYDESAKAREVARHFGQGFDSVPCSPALIAENLPKAVFCTEMALANYNAVAKTVLSGHVRSRGVKVCLTGEGSDELFAGYPYFKLEQLWRMEAAGGQQEQRSRELQGRFRQMEYRSEGLLWDRSRRWKRATRAFGYPSYFHLRARDARKAVKAFFDAASLGLTAEDMPENILRTSVEAERWAGLDPFNVTRLLTLNQLSNLVIPTLGDRVEMVHSLECRPPFLDRALLELAGTIPPRHFIDLDTLQEKHLLKEAFKDLLPPPSRREHKHPFLAPTWAGLGSTPAGRELFAEFLSPAAARRAGVFRPWAVGLARLALRWCPLPRGVGRKLDALLGTVLTAHLLHHQFVEKGVCCDPDFPMTDRGPESLRPPRAA